MFDALKEPNVAISIVTNKAQATHVKNIVFIETFFRFSLSSILGMIGSTIAKLDKEPSWLKAQSVYSEILLSLNIGRSNV